MTEALKVEERNSENMAKFNGGYKNAYALAEMARYFGNTLKYYRGCVDDDDYFDPIVAIYGNVGMENEIIRVFGRDELVRKGVCRDSREHGPGNGRNYGRQGTNVEGDGPTFCFINCDATDSLQSIWNEKSMNARCRAMLAALVERYLGSSEKRARQDVLRLRFEETGRFFKFTDLELEILRFAYIRGTTAFNSDPFAGRRNGTNWNQRMNFYAMALDRSVAEVKAACAADACLRKYEFINSDLDIKSDIQEYLAGEDNKPLQGRFFRERKMKDVLPWNFYGKSLQRHGELIRRLVSSKHGGVNVLLYGEPGSGKTSFAETLAEELGRRIYEVMHGDENGQNTSLGSRLVGVQVCNEQMPDGAGIMMVDEADEILETSFGGGGLFGLFGGSRGGRRESEKGQVNSMLDNIRQPTFWISNAPASSMADSVRRRFDYSICFGKPSHEMRVSIWRNNVRKLRLGRLIDDSEIDGLASRYETSAGGISMALKNLKELAPKKSEVPDFIQRLMEPHCELMGTSAANDGVMSPAKDYTLEGLNLSGDVDLSCITEAVRNYYGELESKVEAEDRPRMNLLLWGPPGTGKTEFVKYLAKTLNRKVLVKMGSDLLSMWVGGTEHNIKSAFREAADSGAILFLDEIDGLVQDRSGANRSWEVTQVNELLYQMENFKGAMVGATNFMDNLDQAIMRRFTFKLKFDYLDEAGKRLFFERMFKTKLTDDEAAELKEVRNLAPGDFRTVRQSMYYLGGTVTNSQRIAALAKESEVKKDTKKAGRIGFGG